MHKSGRTEWTGYLFLLPAALTLILVCLYPIFKNFYYSFREMSLIFKTNSFIGFGNYNTLIHDVKFWNATQNTVIFTVATVFFEAIIGLLIAIIINKSFYGRGAVRAAVLVPWAIPTVVTALMWKWIYNSDFGVLNFILVKVGILQTNYNWLGNDLSSLICIIFADVWKTVPFITLLALSGLQTISLEVYEAAKIDGTSAWRTFISITMPMIKRVFLVAILLRALDAFRVYDLVYVLTNGGPGDSTEVLSTYTYKVLFSTGNFGYGSTLAVAMFMFVALLGLIYFLLQVRFDKEEQSV